MHMRCALALVTLLLAASPALAQGDGTNANGRDLNVPMLTRDQAAAFLPPPVPVVDLSKPGLVYHSNDPLVAAAVADYLSKIKEPHDEFGNLITPNYKSATTPDTVDSKVIAAIATFVAGRRFIALSPRAAMSLRATQDIQRQKDIDKIIYDDWAAKVRAKADNINRQNGANANNANRPPAGDGGGGNANTSGPSNPNSNGGAGGGNANGNGNPGGGNENVPNLNNNNSQGNSNTPAQAGAAAALSTEFGVTVLNEPKPWTDGELSDLRDVLMKLPPRFYKGVQFARSVLITPKGGQPDPLILGVCRNTGDSAGTVTISDGYLRTDSSAKQDWLTPPWTTDEAIHIHMRAIMAHELTHNFQFYGEGKDIGPLTNSTIVKNFAATFGWTFDSATSRWSFDSTRRAERPSQYAIGTPDNPTAPEEDMAESVAFFFYDPARLRATSAADRSRYNWVRDNLGLATQPEDPTHTVGTPAQRGVGR